MNPLRIATRQSPLALWQARHVADLLTARHRGLRVELVQMVTEGDRILDRALNSAGGKGLFIKELEQGLADGRADLAVHSMKDVPAEPPTGFVLAAFCAAADPRDALVSPVADRIEALPPGARIGTASLRRGCQLLALRPDLELVMTRGNVHTRLAKLDRGDCDALLLAAAGLDRLGLAGRIAARLSIEQMLPAVTQGVLGLECRAGDEAVLALLAPLQEPDTALRVRAERAFAARLGGGCHTPLAAHAVLNGTRLHLTGLVGSPDGRRVLRQSLTGPAEAPEALGLALAEQLIAQGAAHILADHG
ncbi:hydroxymethylbilane synthase [Immundisolibacter sp.]|uniref:hydroxymethylbilane synthase n=1 Tax=Immundisolibacter sp. TaxID=1934948 RepID=UPI00263551CF|nr:hydroxymethylbilane synthase [Immundisolibacter sp.]MDD3651054.1 hydroxymethylbilane synthase [Immundisolibacter sp.]